MFACEKFQSHPLLGSEFLFIPAHKKRNHPKGWFSFFRAGKGTRTLDPDLGKVVLYQLSYSREVSTIIAYGFKFVKGLCKENIKISCFFPLNSKKPSFFSI